MYIRIIHDEYEDLYDCARAKFKPHKEDEHKFILCMEGVPHLDTASHIIDKTRDEVYVMNDHGQTIDSYVWQSLKE